MSKGIILSQKHGVNPHLTYCPKCGGDSRELILTGAASMYECSCGQKHIGRPEGGKCVKCSSYDLTNKGEIPPETKLPGDLCEACEKEQAEFKAEIDRGGIPFRCKDCGATGVIKAEHELAKKVRAEHGLAGLEFTKEDCPRCRKEE